jgi:FMN reductase
MRLVAILGSVTPPGRLRMALAGALERSRSDVESMLLDLAELRIAFADGRPPEALDDDTAATVAAIGKADAVIVATPVYRGSLTGALKNLFDHLPVTALEGKPVGLVAMGASDHHFLGAERHLRDVLAFFGALGAPVAVYLTSADFHDGAPLERAQADLDALLDEILELSRLNSNRSQSRLRPLVARARPKAVGQLVQ